MGILIRKAIIDKDHQIVRVLIDFSVVQSSSTLGIDSDELDE